MQANLQIGGYEIEFDRDATAACYSRFRVPGPESCGCAYCRNWIAARKDVLPAEFHELLSQFGIPANGEIEVWETPGQTQPHFYCGWYYIVGHILCGELARTFNIGSLHLSFAPKAVYLVPQFEGQPVCELDFHTEISEYLPAAEYDSPPYCKIPTQIGAA